MLAPVTYERLLGARRDSDETDKPTPFVIDYRQHGLLKCCLSLLAGFSSYSPYGHDER